MNPLLPAAWHVRLSKLYPNPKSMWHNGLVACLLSLGYNSTYFFGVQVKILENRTCPTIYRPFVHATLGIGIVVY